MGLLAELLLEAKIRIKTRLQLKIILIMPKFYKYDNLICVDYKNEKNAVIMVQSKAYYERNLLIVLFCIVYWKIYAYFKIKHENQVIQLEEAKINENNAKGYVSFRQYYKEMLENFDLILFNSEITKSEYNKYINLRQIKHIVLPVSHSNIKDNRQTIKYKATNNNKVIFLYMGPLLQLKAFGLWQMCWTK